jgi:hypothetical protein
LQHADLFCHECAVAHFRRLGDHAPGLVLSTAHQVATIFHFPCVGPDPFADSILEIHHF